MDSEATRRYFFFGLLIAGLLFAIFLLWPFLKVIILAMVLSVVLYPVYTWLLHRVSRGNKWIAAFLTILVFLIVICVPLFFISKSVIHQAQDILTFLATPGKTASIVDGFNNFIKTHFSWVPVDLDSYAASLAQRAAASLGSIISVVLGTLLSLLLLILTLFYFLKDGGEWNTTLASLSPLSTKSTQKIFNKLKLAMNGVMKGYLLVAIAQGTLMGVGLWIFGVPNPALWGVLTGLASLVPTIGTSLVSIPSAIYLFVSGHVGAGVGFVIWAMCAVGLVDNLLNPFIVGRSVEIHPMLILFSVLGGVALMGPIGIVLGPLAISFVFAVMSVYSSEIKHEETPV